MNILRAKDTKNGKGFYLFTLIMFDYLHHFVQKSAQICWILEKSAPISVKSSSTVHINLIGSKNYLCLKAFELK